MKYLLFLTLILLLSSCTPRRLIVRDETSEGNLAKVPGRDKWILISKAFPYENYILYNYGRRLQAGDLIVYDWKRARVKEVAVQPICPGVKEAWIILNYPDLTGGYKCGCK